MGLASGLPNFTIYGKESGLVGDTIVSMTANERDIWVNTFYPTNDGAVGGISTYSFKNDSWTTYRPGDGLATNVIQGLGIDHQGCLWMCQSFGVQVIDTSHTFVASYGPDEGLKGAGKAVDFQGENIVWVGTTEGIGRFDRTKNEWKMFTPEDGLVHKQVYKIAVDDEVVWIATGGGLSRYDTSTGEWKNYHATDGLADDIVNSIAVTKKYVWFATRGGLSRLNKKKGTFTNYGRVDGLPSDNILDVAVFREKVWVATSDGVGKLEGRWKIIDSKDGLPISSVKKIATQKDYIWFGTGKGVARYGPLGPGLTFNSPYFLVIVLVIVLGAVLIVIRPGAKKAETSTQRPGKPEKPKSSEKPPYDVCGGTPQKQLCTRCKYYRLKGETLQCAKYRITIVFGDDSGTMKQQQTKKLQQIKKPQRAEPKKKEEKAPGEEGQGKKN